MLHVLKELIQLPVIYFILFMLLMVVFKNRKRLFYISTFLLVVLTLGMSPLGSFMVLKSLVLLPVNKNSCSTEYIAILPAGVDAYSQDDKIPELFGYYRVEHASNLFAENNNIKFVIPGNEYVEEPLVYKNALVKLGVNESNIEMIPGSSTTFENIQDLAHFSVEKKVELCVLTSDWHGYRVANSISNQGLDWNIILSAQPIHYSIVPSLRGHWQLKAAIHEWMGIVWYKITGRN